MSRNIKKTVKGIRFRFPFNQITGCFQKTVVYSIALIFSQLAQPSQHAQDKLQYDLV